MKNIFKSDTKCSNIKENKIEKSIEYFIRASDHEYEPLIYRDITRDDKRLKISKTFIK